MNLHKYVHWEPVSRRWVVAEYRDGRYYAPMTTACRKLTGCTTVFGSLHYCIGNAYSYTRKAAAEKRARELYEDFS